MNGAWPVTPEAAAPATRAARAASARMAGTASSAAVPAGLPAASAAANEIVYPSALTYDPLAR